MPKLIDYPRTSYAGAWEVADVVDDTGGKCALETCARKLNRKVSGSFKAIIGSAVKFGLMTSKRELLTTTTLFRRIKHAYDKQEELLFHREAFLTPPLFTQLCRKFRSRELPVQMLDIMLIREFDVEEINAQGVAKAFIDGARMVGLIDEHNIVADIDQLAAQQPPRRELASPELSANSFRGEVARANQTLPPTSITPEPLFSSSVTSGETDAGDSKPASLNRPQTGTPTAPLRGQDAVASLFGLSSSTEATSESIQPKAAIASPQAVNNHSSSPALVAAVSVPAVSKAAIAGPMQQGSTAEAVVKPEQRASLSHSGSSELPVALSQQVLSPTSGFRIELHGPGLNTVLDIQDEDDLALARVLLDKIERQLKTK